MIVVNVREILSPISIEGEAGMMIDRWVNGSLVPNNTLHPRAPKPSSCFLPNWGRYGIDAESYAYKIFHNHDPRNDGFM